MSNTRSNIARENAPSYTKSKANAPGLPGKRIKLSEPFYSISSPTTDASPTVTFLTPSVYSSPKPRSLATPRRMNKYRPIGTRVDTNVPTYQGTLPQQIFFQPGKSHEAFIKSSSPIARSRSKKKGHRPLPLKTDREVSLYDRRVPILVSVPLSTDWRDQEHCQTVQIPNKAKAPAALLSPTIETLRWSKSPREHRTRYATSSVYTRTTSWARSVVSPRRILEAPLVPSPSLYRDGHAFPVMLADSKHRVRSECAVSICTVFEEDDLRFADTERTPLATQGRKRSPRSESVETVLPTPRRSHGWWNVITSPFLTRSNTNPDRHDFAFTEEDADTHAPMLGHVTPLEDDRDVNEEDAFQESLDFTSIHGLSQPIEGYDGELGEAVQHYGRNVDFGNPSTENAVMFSTDNETNHEQVRAHMVASSSEKPQLRTSPDRAQRYDLDGSKRQPRRIDVAPHSTGRTKCNPLVLRSTSPPFTNLSPVLGVASIRFFQTARSIEMAYDGTCPTQSHETRRPLKVSNENYDTSVQRTIKPTILREKRTLEPKAPKKRSCMDGVYNYRNFNKCKGSQPFRNERCTLITLIMCLTGLILFTTIMVMTITQQHGDIHVQVQWVNLTAFPPIPTGISTVAQPDAVLANSGCVQDENIWSCSLLQNQQQSASSHAINQPDFRLEIRVKNGTVSDSLLIQSKNGPVSRRASSGGSQTAAAGQIARNQNLGRDAFSDMLFTPNPAPPSTEDRSFLGNTTDNVTEPFEGEPTPFIISILPTTISSSSRLAKRQQPVNIAASYLNIINKMPPPNVNPDGRAADADLYPFPVAQPLLLFDRGLGSEHYGFYTYFDRSLFLANARCTWSQTRFLVQIWTKAGAQKQLLPPSSSKTPSTNGIAGDNRTLSAFDFARPGSFPWPVTITIDRHGGDPSKKAVYCYGVNTEGDIVSNETMVVAEDRGSGGTVVNAAGVPFADMQVSSKNGGYGGVDGGTGGCRCQWDNWQ